MANLILIEQDRPRATLVISRDADAVVRHAAEELQLYLEKIAGARLPESETVPPAGPAVLLGHTAEVERLVGDFAWASLKEDGVLVRTIGERLILAGATGRGTLYAVYEFLERVLGCRWLTATVSVIPKRDTIELGDLDFTHTPPFRYREVFFANGWDADWQARNRLNGAFAPLDAQRGGKMDYAGFVHTFETLVPPREFFATHPEYYSELNGERTDVQSQLCLTNPELVGVVTDRARQWLRDNPAARILSISQNDWYGHCQCVSCKAMDEAEGSPSGTMVRFVNAVAERLEGEFPYVLFDTLAYTYTVSPPRHARPRRNVVIRLCNITPCCDVHPLEVCPQNRDFVGYLKGWGEIAPEVFIWDYFNTFRHYFMPLPNLDAIGADLPMYARNGVTGVFCQLDGTPPKGPGEFGELKAYVLAKLLWDPRNTARNAWAVTREFCTLYYGAAAEPILRYLELVHEQVRGKDVHGHLYSDPGAAYLTPEFLRRAETIFDEAERAAGSDAVVFERVRVARLPLQNPKVRGDLAYALRGDRYEPAPEARLRAEAFFTGAKAAGAKAMREGGTTIEQDIAALAGFEVVRLEGRSLLLVVAPDLGGRLLSLLAGSPRTEWLHQARPHEHDFPFAGGYEEYSESRWRTPGWKERYAVERGDGALRLTAQLENGLHFERVFRLIDGGIQLDSTLRNDGKSPFKATLRPHPELRLGDPARATVVTPRAGGPERVFAGWREADEGNVWLTGAELPAGWWSLHRGDGELRMEFDAAMIEKALLSWDRGLDTVRLELFAHPVLLAPGESTTLRQRWLLRG
jgi:hypothetical protein